MLNKKLNKNIKKIDETIEVLMEQAMAEDITKQKYDEIMAKIDKLTDIRRQLSENKVSESHAKEILSGLIGITGMVLVLKHEKADIITTKAFSMATKLFRG